MRCRPPTPPGVPCPPPRGASVGSAAAGLACSTRRPPPSPPSAPPAHRLASDPLEEAVELLGAPHEPLGGLEADLPPQRLDALLWRGPIHRAFRQMAPSAVDDVMLEQELDPIRVDRHEPAVMAPPHPWPLDPVRELFPQRGDLHVTGDGHPLQLRDDPDRVAHVLERVRADRKVEPVALERPGL